MVPSLETELLKDESIKTLVQDQEFAIELYCALCNVDWFKDLMTEPWGCSWRYAGGIVADLRNQNEDYLDFYCSGIGHPSVHEGHVTERVAKELLRLGWRFEKME